MERNDFRFEIIDQAEDLDFVEEIDFPRYWLRQIELVVMPPDETWPVETMVDGELIDEWLTRDPYGDIAAAREAQAFTLEERWAMDAEREMRERMGAF